MFVYTNIAPPPPPPTPHTHTHTCAHKTQTGIKYCSKDTFAFVVNSCLQITPFCMNTQECMLADLWMLKWAQVRAPWYFYAFTKKICNSYWMQYFGLVCPVASADSFLSFENSVIFDGIFVDVESDTGGITLRFSLYLQRKYFKSETSCFGLSSCVCRSLNALRTLCSIW